MNKSLFCFFFLQKKEESFPVLFLKKKNQKDFCKRCAAGASDRAKGYFCWWL
jgi:hypothetical protein